MAAAWPGRRSFFLLAVAATALAVYGSLVPLHFRPIPLDVAVERFRQIPFLRLGVNSRADWVANILLFVPISYLWLGAVMVDRGGRRRAVWAVPLVVTLAALLSTSLEFLQLWFPPRTVSQNDVVAELIGAVLGAALWLWTGQTITDWVRSYTANPRPRSQIDWLLEAYVAGLLIYSVLPLDLTISPRELVHKYVDGKIALVPFADAGWGPAAVYALFRDVAVFVPVGMLVSTWLAPRDRPVRSLGESILLGGLVALGIELAQLVVYSRYTSVSDVVLGTIGAGIGAWAMRRWRGGTPRPDPTAGPGNRPAWLVLALAAAYAGFLVVVFCAPFEPAGDYAELKARYDGFWHVPFGRLYYGSEFNAASEVLKKTLFFAPLGAICAVAAARFDLPRPVRRILLAGLLAAAAALAAAIEMLQVFLPPHVPDVTDVILYTAGAAAGMLIAIRVLDARDRA